MSTENFSYRIVVRNASLNLAGRVLLAVVSVATIPVLIRGLGLERYGILSLALVTVSYFSLLDCGLCAATTKFVAGALGRGEVDRIGRLIWTSLLLIAGLGLLAGLLMFCSAPWLAEDLLRVSPPLRAQTKSVLYLLSMLAPLLLIGAGLQGLLEARQRYDLVNLVTIPASLVSYLAPVGAIALGLGLVPIAVVLVFTRAAACAALFLLCQNLYPQFREPARVSMRGMRPLLVFGGWLAVSNVVWPVLLYFDRLVIGALLPIALLPFYSAPCELVTRLWAVPASWVALFPAFSAAEQRGDDLSILYARGLKHLAVLLGPVTIITVFFAGDILRIWVGEQFRAASTVVFRVLALGVLANSLASVPDRLIKAMGRSDIIAKLHLAQLLLYGALLYALVRQWGIIGASVAWTVRAIVEAAVIFLLSYRLVPESGMAMMRAGIGRLGLVLAVLAAAMGMTMGLFTGAAQLGAAGLLLILTAWFGWRRILDQEDRDCLRAALNLAPLAPGQA